MQILCKCGCLSCSEVGFCRYKTLEQKEILYKLLPSPTYQSGAHLQFKSERYMIFLTTRNFRWLENTGSSWKILLFVKTIFDLPDLKIRVDWLETSSHCNEMEGTSCVGSRLSRTILLPGSPPAGPAGLREPDSYTALFLSLQSVRGKK